MNRKVNTLSDSGKGAKCYYKSNRGLYLPPPFLELFFRFFIGEFIFCEKVSEKRRNRMKINTLPLLKLFINVVLTF